MLILYTQYIYKLRPKVVNFIYLIYCIGIDIMEVGDTGFGLGAKLEFFFGPNFGTIMVVTNQDKPSYTCINAHTRMNMNILIID